MSFRSNPEVKLTRVNFRVIAPVQYGETLCVVGDAPALGSGDPEYGVALVTTPEKFPEWFLRDPIPFDAGREVKYKYAIFSGGNFSRWEERSDPRMLKVKDAGTSQTVVDEIVLDAASTGSVPTQSKQLPPFKKLSRTSTTDSSDRAGSGANFRGGRKKGLDLENDDGVIVVSYFLPVRISKVSPDSESSDNETKETLDYENKGIRDSRSIGEVGNVTGRRHSHLRSFSSVSSGGNERPNTTWSIEWDESALLSRKKSSVADHMRVLYIGYPNCSSEILPHEHESLASALVRFRCVPVFLDPEERDLHYHVYCYDTLRKLFHHHVDVYAALPTRWWNGPMHEASWIAYRSVNQAFAEKVVEVYNEGDIVWIHGYELLLLPSLLARRLQAGKPHIGLFIHSPFPSSEIFRTLSVRDDILRGMLNADQIGFHLYEYARPFLSCCHRILGIQHHGNENDTPGVLTVEYQGRRVFITVCHAGIEPDLVKKTLRKPKVFSKARTLLLSCINKDPEMKNDVDDAMISNCKDQVLIVGLDEMEHLRGVSFKLDAYEEFLRTQPAWADKVCLIQIFIKVQRDSTESIECRSTVRGLARRINENYPRPVGKRPAVCLLEWSTVSFEDRLALFSIADIFLSVPLRSGLRLPDFEFTVVASERQIVDGPWKAQLNGSLDTIRKNPTLVLSEFTAAFRVLPASLRCNPWRRLEMVETLVQALTMPEGERLVRSSAALKYVTEHVESGWALRVLTDLKSARPLSQEKKNEGLTPAGLGLGLQFRAIEFRPNFKHLDDKLIIERYRNSLRRLIILDYGGTTVSDDYIPINESTKHKFEFRYRPQGEAIVPSDNMVNVLKALVMDPANHVFIVSGRERQELEAAFRDVPGIGLTAEHGCFYSWGRFNSSAMKSSLRTITPPLIEASNQELHLKYRRSRSASVGHEEHQHQSRFSNNSTIGSRKCQQGLLRNWVRLSDRFEDSWMDLSEQIMDVYTQRTDGTYIERKGSSVVWQYRDAEPEFGALQAAELQDHLHGVLKAFPTEVVSGKGYVEVCPVGVDKGNACAHILDMLFPDDELPEFILCLGDDIADEAMFEYFQELLYEESSSSGGGDQGAGSGSSQSATDAQFLRSLSFNEKNPGDNKIPVGKEGKPQDHTQLFTCVVGEKPSVAQYYVNDVDEVCELLGVLARVSTKTQFSRSLTDVRRLEHHEHPPRRSYQGYSELKQETPPENSKSNTPPLAMVASSTIHEHEEGIRKGSVDSFDTTDDESTPNAKSASIAASAARASKHHKSFLDLRIVELSSKNTNNILAGSSSMPALSEYFSLDVSQPTSTTAIEYLDLIGDDDDGITF